MYNAFGIMFTLNNPWLKPINLCFLLSAHKSELQMIYLILSIPVVFKQLRKTVFIFIWLESHYYVAKANQMIFSYISSLKRTAIDFFDFIYSGCFQATVKKFFL